MVKSSIHIQGSVDGVILHNARENFSYSVVFFDEENELKNNSKQAYEIYMQELQSRQLAYKNIVGQSPQKNTLTQLSAVFNLHKHHRINDVEVITSYLEDKLDTKVYQIAIHRDEGKLVDNWTKKELYSGKTFFYNHDDQAYYYDKDHFKKIDLQKYTVIKNYHAHVEMMGIDSKGKSIKRNRLHIHFLRELQTFVATSLNMQRGKHNLYYTKEEKKQIIEIVGPIKNYLSILDFEKKFDQVAKKLNIYKENKKRKDTAKFKEYGVVVQDLKEEIFQLRENVELEKYDLELLKEDYAQLENENETLENETFNFRDDIFNLKQALKMIRRKLNIFNDIEYHEEDLSFEKLKMEDVSSIVNGVSDLILLVNKKLSIKSTNEIKKEINKSSNPLVEKDDDINYFKPK